MSMSFLLQERDPRHERAERPALARQTRFANGSVASGEIVTLFGSKLGPPSLVTLQIQSHRSAESRAYSDRSNGREEINNPEATGKVGSVRRGERNL